MNSGTALKGSSLILSTLALSLGLWLTLPVAAQDDPVVSPPKHGYSPYTDQDFPKQVLFGDSHLHTSYSPDAGMIGNTLGPDAAYRFARGELVTSSMGVPARLVRPLDWLAVTDHAEGLGIAPLVKREDPSIMESEFGRQLHAYVSEGTPESLGNAWNFWAGARMKNENPYSNNPDFSRKPWKEIIDAAEAAYQPGLFTALIGFEWTSTPGGDNLHRVVLYRDGKEVASSSVPPSSDSDPNPESLWNWMEKLEARTGGRVLAIPHNGNLSNGQMFDDTYYGSDKPLDAAYAQRRARFEPLYEVTQMKGDAETHPALSPQDSFADFETWGTTNMGGGAKTADMLPKEYARSALARGLAYEATLGTNPFKFGMIGSTDSHTSLSTTREENFFGKVAQLEPSADPIRMQEPIAGRLGAPENMLSAWQTSASGLAAVWAIDNTREAIFDAMMRREVYATTGTRIRVRVFAGYNFTAPDLRRPDFAAYGYAHGVPMGGDLTGSHGQAPGILIHAMRDPDGANLDRLQVIKGWHNRDGSTAEKIYDVDCGERKIKAAQCDGEVGNTTDFDGASWTNDIGRTSLAAFWKDPDFDPGQRAFYYVRVLEIPTPRWTTYDRKYFGVDLPDDAPQSIQERAYTSPIWYTPALTTAAK